MVGCKFYSGINDFNGYKTFSTPKILGFSKPCNRSNSFQFYPIFAANRKNESI